MNYEMSKHVLVILDSMFTASKEHLVSEKDTLGFISLGVDWNRALAACAPLVFAVDIRIHCVAYSLFLKLHTALGLPFEKMGNGGTAFKNAIDLLGDAQRKIHTLVQEVKTTLGNLSELENPNSNISMAIRRISLGGDGVISEMAGKIAAVASLEDVSKSTKRDKEMCTDVYRYERYLVNHLFMYAANALSAAFSTARANNIYSIFESALTKWLKLRAARTRKRNVVFHLPDQHKVGSCNWEEQFLNCIDRLTFGKADLFDEIFTNNFRGSAVFSFWNNDDNGANADGDTGQPSPASNFTSPLAIHRH